MWQIHCNGRDWWGFMKRRKIKVLHLFERVRFWNRAGATTTISEINWHTMVLCNMRALCLSKEKDERLQAKYWWFKKDDQNNDPGFNFITEVEGRVCSPKTEKGQLSKRSKIAFNDLCIFIYYAVSTFTWYATWYTFPA